MNILTNPSKNVKLIFAALTFPVVALFAFFFLEDGLATMAFTIFGVFPLLLLTLIFWLIDRKKHTRLRFYSNYLLLSLFGLSILFAILSRVFYTNYLINSRTREDYLHYLLEDYRTQFGHLPESLNDPFLHGAPTGSILPVVGRYSYKVYSNRDELNPPKVVEKPKVGETYILDSSTVYAVAKEAPPPTPSVKTPPKPTQLIESYRIMYKSLFGRIRCYGDCHGFERENGEGFINSDVEEFLPNYGETDFGDLLKSLFFKEK